MTEYRNEREEKKNSQKTKRERRLILRPKMKKGKRNFSREYKSERGKDSWLVCLVLWHINLCRLFNAKSVFM